MKTQTEVNNRIDAIKSFKEWANMLETWKEVDGMRLAEMKGAALRGFGTYYFVRVRRYP